MYVDKIMLQMVCNFICTDRYKSHWTCKKFYQYIYGRDCVDCEKCEFFDPGEMMEWIKENHIWK